MAQHLVVARLLYVQDFALQRQDRLETAIAALLGGAAGRFALYQKQLATFWIFFLTVGQLARQSAGLARAPHQWPFPRSYASPPGSCRNTRPACRSRTGSCTRRYRYSAYLWSGLQTGVA